MPDPLRSEVKVAPDYLRPVQDPRLEPMARLEMLRRCKLHEHALRAVAPSTTAATAHPDLPSPIPEVIRSAAYLLHQGDTESARTILSSWANYAGTNPHLDTLLTRAGLLGTQVARRRAQTADCVISGPVVAVDGRRALVRLEDAEGHREQRWLEFCELHGVPRVGDLIVIEFQRKPGRLLMKTRIAPRPTAADLRKEEQRLAGLFRSQED